MRAWLSNARRGSMCSKGLPGSQAALSASQACLPRALTEAVRRSVDSALTLNSPTGSRRRDDTRDIEMATVDLDASLEGPEDEKAWAAGRGADHHGAGVPNPKPDQRPSLFARPWQRGLGRGSDGGGFETPQGKSKGLDGRPSLARSVMASARPRRDRADLLAESFRWMFPRSFDRLVPVSNCRVRARTCARAQCSCPLLSKQALPCARSLEL